MVTASRIAMQRIHSRQGLSDLGAEEKRQHRENEAALRPWNL